MCQEGAVRGDHHLRVGQQVFEAPVPVGHTLLLGHDGPILEEQ